MYNFERESKRKANLIDEEVEWERDVKRKVDLSDKEDEWERDIKQKVELNDKEDEWERDIKQKVELSNKEEDGRERDVKRKLELSDKKEDEWERRVKRKVELSDEEEDEWEREADHLPEKLRIAQETHLAALDENNDELRKTKIELEKKLLELEKELVQCEEEEEELLLNIGGLKNENEALTMELTELQTQERLEKKDYLEKDMKLTETLKDILDSWQKIISKDDTVDDEEVELEGLINVYKTTEFDIIDLTAQIEGYQERIRALNEYANNLPKEAPILDETKFKNSLEKNQECLEFFRSSINRHKDEIDAANILLEDMEKEIIQPCLADLANYKVNYPQKHLQEKLDIQLMKNMIYDLDLIYNVALKQRAQQQLMQCLFDKQ